MFIYPSTLSVITTNQCTASCQHCCFSCSPHNSATIPIKNIIAYIDQAKELQSIKVVVFTGGECFLLGQGLDVAVKHAHELGFFTRFVSNGYWATTPEKAAKRVEQLVNCGLTEANFSTGHSHSQYIDPRYVRNGAVACADAGLTTLIVVETFREDTFDFEFFLNEDQKFQEYVESQKIIINIPPWMSFENQDKPTYSQKFIEKTSCHVPCITILETIGITPDEKLVACCGLTISEIPEMVLGDLRENSIEEILDKYPNDIVKFWLRFQGPYALLTYAQSVDPSIEIVKQVAHMCEYCRYVYSNPKVANTIRMTPSDVLQGFANAWMAKLLCAAGMSGASANRGNLDIIKQRGKIEVLRSLREASKSS